MTPFQEQQLSQDNETPVKSRRNFSFAWRYAYARATDTRLAGDTGQDYLRFCCDDRAFAFVLCDGVSQSFYGDLAARILGDCLLRWAWKSLAAHTSKEAIAHSLDQTLSLIVEEASERVRQHPVSKDVPKMVRDVLEQKRALGSQTTFICGRIDAPGSNLVEGRMALAWLGDSRLRLWGPLGERTEELGDSFHTAQRWSTHGGPVGGPPNLYVAPLRQGKKVLFSGITAYSDGLAGLDTLRRPATDSELTSLIAQASESPVSDDISLLEVWVGGRKASEG